MPLGLVGANEGIEGWGGEGLGGGIIIFPTQPFLQKTVSLPPGPKIGYMSVESRSLRNFQEIQQPLPKELVGRGERSSSKTVFTLKGVHTGGN